MTETAGKGREGAWSGSFFATRMKFQQQQSPQQQLPGPGGPNTKCRKLLMPVEKTRCTPCSALCSMMPRVSNRAYFLWIIIAVCALLALFQAGSFLSGSHCLPRVSFAVLKFSWMLGRQWRLHTVGYPVNFTYPGITPPYSMDSSRVCGNPELSLTPNFVTPSYFQRFGMERKSDYFDVCLGVSIGDDGDRPRDDALPYPLVSRLTDALTKEVAEVVANKRAKGGKEGMNDVEVLVGVDFRSIVCPIIEDIFEDLPKWEGVRAHCRRFTEITQGTRCGRLVHGRSGRFVPQLPDGWNRRVEWRSRVTVDLDCLDLGHQPLAIPRSEWGPTIITGFSSNHMTVGLLLLRSIGKAAKEGSGVFKVSVVVWAMEVFEPEFQALLDCVVDELNYEYGVSVDVRLFDWLAYPAWMRINQRYGYFGGTGEYAWKAVMIHTVLRERGFVLWADAGDRFLDSTALYSTLSTLNSTGFVSRSAAGWVQTRTHVKQLKYFRANLPAILDMENCEAAVVGFTLDKYSEVARPWYDCSLTRQCIAPRGSDRSNHRQDQAALTMLSILSNNPCRGAHPRFTDHTDDDKRLRDTSGAYVTKCYVDPLVLVDQGTRMPAGRPHGIIN